MIVISPVSDISISMAFEHLLRKEKCFNHHFFFDSPFFDPFKGMEKKQNSYYFLLKAYGENLTFSMRLSVYNIKSHVFPLPDEYLAWNQNRLPNALLPHHI